MSQIKQIHSLKTLIFLSISAAFIFTDAASTVENSHNDIASDVKKILNEISEYDYGDSRDPLSVLRILIKSSLDSQGSMRVIEKEMISFLESDATFAGKQFVCEQLSIIGTKESIPVLKTLLSEDKTANIALYTLQRIPDFAAERALRELLSDAPRNIKIGIINTLGERKDNNAVNDLEKLVYDADQQTAESAVTALGKIADENAARVLLEASSKTDGELRNIVLDAYLLCADSFFDKGNASRAANIYQELYNNENTIRIRAAALRGSIQTNIDDAPDIILSVLKRDNRELQSVAVGLLRELPGNPDLSAIIEELPSLSDQAQIQLLSAFAYRNESTARNVALEAVKHNDESVRVAALTALSKIGNDSDISLFVRVATEATGTDREAARRSLDLLPGASVDQKIIDRISYSDPQVKAELIRSLSQRNAVSAINTLLKTAVDPDRSVRIESYKSLGIIAQPDNINELIRMLIEEENSGVRNEAERTVVLVAQKIADTSNQAGPVLAQLPSVKNIDARSSLLEVLGRIGDASALFAIRKELNSDNPDSQEAAIHALSAWPNAEPLQELLNVVTTTDNETHKILALRGYINLVRIRSERPAAESIKFYMTAMEHATEVSEKRMILSGLSGMWSGAVEALNIIAVYLEDPSLNPEAEAAIIRLLDRVRDRSAERLKGMFNTGLGDILNKILMSTDNERILEWIPDILDKEM